MKDRRRPQDKGRFLTLISPLQKALVILYSLSHLEGKLEVHVRGKQKEAMLELDPFSLEPKEK
jgi:hypothetical protein